MTSSVSRRKPVFLFSSDPRDEGIISELESLPLNMGSVVEGYTYDIFISYRRKDNLAAEKEVSGWVSEFVARLKNEIQATIKENISVYFDENEYDGILETHDVQGSVDPKLKCLILIPILSQTYCDTSSFAWRNEFLVFKELSSNDQFGLKIKLSNGNVACRILPVRIHELDPEDRATIENEIGPLRSVDFIFRAPGVNRPLSPTDRREDSSSHIIYKDQINKAANAIKDMVHAMKYPHAGVVNVLETNPKALEKRFNWKRILAAAMLPVLIAIAYLYFSKEEKPVNAIGKSIAVLPFVDMTAEHELEYLGDGIAEEVINSLTSIRDLKIIGRTSSFQFKGENLDLREIGKKLNVATVLEGSLQRSGNKLRITAQLIRTDDNTHIWSERYDVEQTDIFKIQDNIAKRIVEKLNLTVSTQEQNRLIKKETSEEAYTNFLKGLFQYKQERFNDALPFFEKVVALDSQYAPGYAYLGLSKTWRIIREKDHNNLQRVEDAIRIFERAMELDPSLPEGFSGRALVAWAIQRDFTKAHTYFEKSLELDPGSSLIKNRYAYFLTWMGELEKSSNLAQAAMQLDPVDYNSYLILYTISVYTEKFDEAYRYHRELYNIIHSPEANFARDIELQFLRGNFSRVIGRCDSISKTPTSLSDAILSYWSMASSAVGQSSQSNQLLTRLKNNQNSGVDHHYRIARVLAFRKEIDSCFVHLNKSFANREPYFNHFQIDTSFKDLRDDPRYQKLFSEYGFDKY